MGEVGLLNTRDGSERLQGLALSCKTSLAPRNQPATNGSDGAPLPISTAALWWPSGLVQERFEM